MSEDKDLIHVNPSLSNAPQITLNPRFIEVLNETKSLVDQYDQLVANVDFDTLDETQIDDLTKELKPMQKQYKMILAAKKQMRRLFDQQKDEATEQLDQRLDAAGMSRLAQIDAQKKQLRRDLLSHRINKRWDELEPTFKANLDVYPIIKEFATPLTDWGNFRVNHSSLISGGKTAKVTDKQRGVVNNEIAQWADDLQAMKSNDLKIPTPYRGAVLNEWIKNPSHDNLLRLTKYYQEVYAAKQKAIADAQKAKDEQKVQAAKLAMQQAAQPKPKSTNINGEYAWLVDYAFGQTLTHNLHTDKAKAVLIYQLTTNITNPKSIFGQKIGQDYEKMLAAIRYILSL